MFGYCIPDIVCVASIWIICQTFQELDVQVRYNRDVDDVSAV